MRGYDGVWCEGWTRRLDAGGAGCRPSHASDQRVAGTAKRMYVLGILGTVCILHIVIPCQPSLAGDPGPAKFLSLACFAIPVA